MPLAMITWLESPAPQPPLGIWGGSSPWPGYVGGGPMPGGPPPWVSHPIPPTVWPNPPTGGGPPLGHWGGDAPWPGYATPPIAPGGTPPGIWGGVPPLYVDIGLPGGQPHPAHPIVLPPDLPTPVPPDKMLVVVWIPGSGYEVKVVTKPPGYNPPPGAAVPTPQKK